MSRFPCRQHVGQDDARYVALAAAFLLGDLAQSRRECRVYSKSKAHHRWHRLFLLHMATVCRLTYERKHVMRSDMQTINVTPEAISKALHELLDECTALRKERAVLRQALSMYLAAGNKGARQQAAYYSKKALNFCARLQVRP